MKDHTLKTQLLTAASSNATGETAFVGDYDEIWIKVASASSANLLLSFVGSADEEKPNFSVGASATNHYTTLAFSDASVVASELPDATSGTGLTFSGTDQFKILKVLNGNGIKWMSAKVSSYSAGNVSVWVWGIKHV